VEGSAEFEQTLERLKAGDKQALSELFDMNRDRLRRMIERDWTCASMPRLVLRRVAGNVYRCDAARAPFLKKRTWPSCLVAAGRQPALVDVHRHHLGAQIAAAGLPSTPGRHSDPASQLLYDGQVLRASV